jgi:hypothetical protein
MRQVALFLVLLLVGCATSPEAKLVQGYKSATAVVKGTTVLVNRDQISVTDAENVHALGTTSKATLDSGKEALKACRATPGATCTAAVANIDLGAGVLMQLENYLKAREAK